MGILRITAAVAIAVLISGCGSAGEAAGNGHAVPPFTPVTPNYSVPPQPYTSTSSPVPEPTPGAGLKLSVGIVEAGLGHRASVLTLTNRDTRTLSISGYPDVHVLDAGAMAMDVRVVHGTSYFAKDPGPRTTRLAPQEKVLAVLSWSATVTDGDSQTGAFVTVSPGPGEPPQPAPLRTDIGTTGEVIVSAWASKIPE